MARKALTVSFQEPALLARLNAENRGGDAKLYRGGPLNAQALNRYSYVLNNPVKYTDPTGHLYYGGDQTAGYRSVCKNGAGTVGGCDSVRGGKPIRDPTKGELVETWVQNEDGSFTYRYYWSGADEFTEFKSFADASHTARLNFLAAVGGAAAAVGVAIPSCAAAPTIVGGVICGIAITGGVIAVAYAIEQVWDWHNNWKWAQLHQQYYPGVTLPNTYLRPHRSQRNPYS